MGRIAALKKKFYPNDEKDGTLIFYTWLRQYAAYDATVLNVGAGPSSERKLGCLKGEVKQVIGVDIDPVVLDNVDLDRAFVIKDNTLPIPDAAIDLAWADYVMEHVEHPSSLLREIYRVLKPGCSIFFRTPNKYHYVSLIGAITPHWFHGKMANRARGLSGDAHEPYPTFYRFNSEKAILASARAVGFDETELRFMEAEPSYLAFHHLAFRVGVLYERLVNASDRFIQLRSNIFGRLTKEKL